MSMIKIYGYSSDEFTWNYKFDHLKNRSKLKKVTKQRILLRDKKCLKCGSFENLTIDHIIPRCYGGSNNDGNLQVLCETCNGEKGQKRIDYRKFNKKK